MLVYYFTSTNGITNVYFLIDLVAVAPMATISPKPTVTVSEGNSAVVMCTATGVPTPTISWCINGMPLHIQNSSEAVEIVTNRVTSTIALNNVMKDSASATITCKANNGVGVISVDSTVLMVLCKWSVLYIHVMGCDLCMIGHDAVISFRIDIIYVHA